MLDGALRAVKAALASGDIAALLPKLVLFWGLLAVHIRAEHLCLFPAIAAAVQNLAPDAPEVPSRLEVEAAISHLRDDHDYFMKELSGAVRQLRDVPERDDH